MRTHTVVTECYMYIYTLHFLRWLQMFQQIIYKNIRKSNIVIWLNSKWTHKLMRWSQRESEGMVDLSLIKVFPTISHICAFDKVVIQKDNSSLTIDYLGRGQP